MRKFDRFQRGSGLYTCDSCGRKTRDTGTGADSICGLCFELGGLDTINDNGLNDAEAAPYRREAYALLIEIVKRGGNGARAMVGCDFIWPNLKAEVTP